MSKIPESANEFIEGSVLLINKPLKWTSFDVVKKIRFLIKKKYSIKKIKVGHAGTLDPLATGLLIICTGKATKNISKIQNQKKVYTGEIILGASTPSYDLETEIDKEFPIDHITKDLIKNKSGKFIGKIKQTPPIFSALKQNGERLYKKARRGEKPIVKSRTVYIDKFNVLNFKSPKLNFEITCSKGTYIRSIAYDFGKSLKSGAHLSKLCRTEIGSYKLQNSVNIEEFEKFLNK